MGCRTIQRRFSGYLKLIKNKGVYYDKSKRISKHTSERSYRVI